MHSVHHVYFCVVLELLDSSLCLCLYLCLVCVYFPLPSFLLCSSTPLIFSRYVSCCTCVPCFFFLVLIFRCPSPSPLEYQSHVSWSPDRGRKQRVERETRSRRTSQIWPIRPCCDPSSTDSRTPGPTSETHQINPGTTKNSSLFDLSSSLLSFLFFYFLFFFIITPQPLLFFLLLLFIPFTHNEVNKGA